MELTFATWDIGGPGPSGTRLGCLLGAIGDLAPTVVAVQDCGCADRGCSRTLSRAGQQLGMRGYLRCGPGGGCHLALFVREGAGLIVVAERPQRPCWQGLACVAVTADGSRQPLHVASVCPAHSRPAPLLGEASALGMAAGRYPAIAGAGTAGGAALEAAGFLDAAAARPASTPGRGHAGSSASRIYTTFPAAAVTACQVVQMAGGGAAQPAVIARFCLAGARPGTSAGSRHRARG